MVPICNILNNAIGELKMDNIELIDYISQIKSPFEEDNTTQEELEFEGYLRYAQDCILKSIGSTDCHKYINLYWTQLNDELSESEFKQFMDVAISTIIKTYRMSFLSDMFMQSDIPSISLEDKKKLFLFLENGKIENYFVKCLSPINIKFTRDDDKLKMFLRADYQSFLKKIDSYKRFNEYISKYFQLCNEDEGIETLYLILKKDLLNVFIQQTYNSSCKKDK